MWAQVLDGSCSPRSLLLSKPQFPHLYNGNAGTPATFFASRGICDVCENQKAVRLAQERCGGLRVGSQESWCFLVSALAALTLHLSDLHLCTAWSPHCHSAGAE